MDENYFKENLFEWKIVFYDIKLNIISHFSIIICAIADFHCLLHHIYSESFSEENLLEQKKSIHDTRQFCSFENVLSIYVSRFLCVIKFILSTMIQIMNLSKFYGGNKPFSINASPKLFLGDDGSGTVDMSSSGGKFISSSFRRC